MPFELGKMISENYKKIANSSTIQSLNNPLIISILIVIVLFIIITYYYADVKPTVKISLLSLSVVFGIILTHDLLIECRLKDSCINSDREDFVNNIRTINYATDSVIPRSPNEMMAPNQTTETPGGIPHPTGGMPVANMYPINMPAAGIPINAPATAANMAPITSAYVSNYINPTTS